MAFYIIERQDQLSQLGPFNDCFVRFIQQNDNYHPKLSPLSLVYVRDLTDHKGYMLCIDHNESFPLQETIEWLLGNTDRIFVLDKKEALYHFPYPDKLYDINFIEHPDLTDTFTQCNTFYYIRHTANPITNKLIPISKHYEECENMFDVVLPIIQQYRADNAVYAFNNGPLTRVFHAIESNGIKVDKQCFINAYGNNLQYPQFNLNKGKIYSQYNLYTLTGRPSNTYNSINFAALNKNDGERLCYIPENDMFVEFDFNSYHPRLIGELIGHPLNISNIYEYLQIDKPTMFKNLYGGIYDDNLKHPYFKKIQEFTDKIWDYYIKNGNYETLLRKYSEGFIESKLKLFNYIIQSLETHTNVNIILNILDYLKDKQTKIILYTYDSILLDFSRKDGDETIKQIKQLMKYPVKIKSGSNLHNLIEIGIEI
jgi:hypothetical protein